jgi:hypothetical protein
MKWYTIHVVLGDILKKQARVFAKNEEDALTEFWMNPNKYFALPVLIENKIMRNITVTGVEINE